MTPPAYYVNSLHRALLRNCFDDAESVISNGSIDVNESDHKGGTPLLYAAWKGCSRLVEKLLKLGADPTATNDSGHNALHASALSGDPITVEMLLKAGTDIHAFDGVCGATPLQTAAQMGNTEVVSVLLDAGAEVDQRSCKSGETALFVAATRGKVEAVRVLLRRGADPELKCLDHTPLEVALKQGHLEVVREFGQRVGFASCGGIEGRLALAYAAAKQDTEAMKIFFDGGVCDLEGEALCSAVSFGKEESIKVLIRRHSDLQSYVNSAMDIDDRVTAEHYLELGRHGKHRFNVFQCCFKTSALRDSSCRILRMLLDAGMKHELIHDFEDPVVFATQVIEQRKSAAEYDEATDEKTRGLQGLLRLLHQRPAVFTKSWGWIQEETGSKTTRKTTRKALRTTTIRVARPKRGANVLVRGFSRKKTDELFAGHEN